MRLGWIIACAALAAFFIVFGMQSFALPMSDELGPGPGFFPLTLSVLGLVLSGLLLYQVWTRFPKPVVEAGPVPAQWRALRPMAVLMLVGLGTLALEPVGYTLTTLALVPAVLLVLGNVSPITTLALSLVLSFGVFHVFYFWLSVPLPVGLLGV